MPEENQGTAGAAYDSAERQEALATRMRAAGAPEKAAAGKGKTVNKIKTTSPRKSQAQGKQHSR